MIRALYSAASGMSAQQTNVDTIANNLANANTAGFKMRRAQFQDLMYQNMIQPGAAAGAQSTVPSGLQLGLGTRTASNEIVFTQGDFSQTSNPLDVVIQGQGFFQIQRQSGDLAYTRAGNFQINKDGNMVTSDGDLLNPQITIPPSAQSITIATDGTVTFTAPGQTSAQIAGQIQLASFPNPAGLNSLGKNLYQPTDASGDAIVGNPGGQEGLGTLLQGYTEQSNVSVVDEFVNLIVSQRAYEANSKVVKAADEMYQQMNNVTQ
jgi:flagellar basal-body rod protein FlgG